MERKNDVNVLVDRAIRRKEKESKTMENDQVIGMVEDNEKEKKNLERTYDLVDNNKNGRKENNGR